MEDFWIYHERQQALLCGQHALNNLVQSDVFTYSSLAHIAHRLDELELRILASEGRGTQSVDYQARLREGSGNVDPQGNFSIQVLKVALEENYGVQLTHALSEDMIKTKQVIDITEMQGFICHKSNHWFTIRQIGGRFWNLNSMEPRPTPISHFDLATKMEGWNTEGYTIFCVPTGLPPVGTLQGKSGVNWHRMSDLVMGRSTEKNPFDALKGKGLRLDGKQNSIDYMTEDEQLAMALQQSVENIGLPALDSVIVPEEPPLGDPQAVRIQFRMPEKRLVRRFHKFDSVDALYAFCQQQSNNRAVSLMCGFPPKELTRGLTIEQAGLANESVQARYL